MPFNRRFSVPEDGFIIDRTLTGPPIVPESGKTQTVDGFIVGDSADAGVSIAPATPVRVTMPGPREPLIDAQGIMTPRWRRFFEELYRRTGQIEDNVNDTSRNVGNSTTGTGAFLGYAPTVTVA